MLTNYFELSPNGGQKSFYGKAKVFTEGDTITLVSYTTSVCCIENGIFKKIWDGYSATTMKHINAFCKLYNIEGGGKSWWDSL